MSTILLHDQQYSIGGPAAVLKGIEESQIGKHHKLIRLAQTEGCGFNPFKALRFIWHYRKEINKYHADSIYICGLQYVGLLMTITAKLSNVKKVVLSVHGSDWDDPDGTLRKWLLKYIVEPLEVCLADSVFTVCQNAQKTIGALKCARKGHNEGVVYNTMPDANYNLVEGGLFRKEFGISSDKIIVSVVGRVVEAKGHRYIIDCLRQFKDNDYIFVIVGDGPYLHHYHEECAELIANKKLILTGRRTDVNNILKDSDIFLFATLNENHSIALLEAVNMRCAALCTEVGGNPEIIENGVSGILIKPCSSDDILKGLLSLKDRNVREKFINNAYESAVVKFSKDVTYGKLEKILMC
jgi:glycosyltransferase involved in cell wall biosynthesis